MHVLRKMSLSAILIYAFLIVLSITCLFPFVFMAMNAFKTMGEYYVNPNGFPHLWSLQSIRTMFQTTDLSRAFVNSFIVTIGAVALTVWISMMAGYSLSKLPFKGQQSLFVGILSCMMIPIQVVVVPLYIQTAGLGVTDTFWLIVLIYSAMFCPFGVYLMRSYFKGISDELLEAAQIDGLGYNGIFFRIMVPLAKPAVASLAVLNFVNIWTEFLVALIFLQDPAKRTVTVDVSLLTSRHLTDFPVIFAGLFFSSIPTIVLFLVFQKYLAKGITAGISK